MAVNISGLRRNLKNVACSYSPAQVKVREATSNDPWGPSSTVMSEVADLTYNVAAFSDVMQMIWKRLNDVGKNWRHVYKALVVLEYLLKTGCDKVIEESKMNIFIVKSLIDFQYLDDNKDHGVNVREKAKALIHLLKNDELLKTERVKALKAKFNTTREKYHASRWMRTSQSMIETSLSKLEDDRPQTKGEEDLQLELAIAMSRGDVEVDEEDGSLELSGDEKPENYSDEDIRRYSLDEEAEGKERVKSSMFDLVDLEFSSNPYEAPSSSSTFGAKKMDPLYMSTPNLSVFGKNRDPWMPQVSPPPLPIRFDSTIDIGRSSAADPSFLPADDQSFFPQRSVPRNETPSSSVVGGQFDPWESASSLGQRENSVDDPFSSKSQDILANFDEIREDIEESSGIGGVDNNPSNDPFVVKLDPSLTSPSLTELNALAAQTPNNKPGVGSLLNEHQNLVDLDNWSPFGKNPFELNSMNPFQPPKQSTPMNKLITDHNSPADSFGFLSNQQQHFSRQPLPDPFQQKHFSQQPLPDPFQQKNFSQQQDPYQQNHFSQQQDPYQQKHFSPLHGQQDLLQQQQGFLQQQQSILKQQHQQSLLQQQHQQSLLQQQHQQSLLQQRQQSLFQQQTNPQKQDPPQSQLNSGCSRPEDDLLF